MVVDSSALIAIFRGEAERDIFANAILSSERRLISAATLVESSIVAATLKTSGAEDLASLVSLFGIAVVPVTQSQAELAVEAFLRFGKGRHPAHLNFGDCFSYALAKERNEPLLSKGDDFPLTDIKRV